MTKNTFLLLAVAVPLLTMGAGCATTIVSDQTNTTSTVTSDSTATTTVVMAKFYIKQLGIVLDIPAQYKDDFDYQIRSDSAGSVVDIFSKSAREKDKNCGPGSIGHILKSKNLYDMEGNLRDPSALHDIKVNDEYVTIDGPQDGCTSNMELGKAVEARVKALRLALPTVMSTLPPTGTIDPESRNDDAVTAKFKLAILNYGQVRNVFRDPQNKNKFYYVTNATIVADMPNNDGSGIYVYDLAKDKTYQESGTFNIKEGSTELLYAMVARNQGFRGVGILGNKFVFVETGRDNSPGPCFSPWFYSNLEYIDLGVSKPARKPFTLSAELKKSEDKKVADCLKAEGL